MSLKNKWLMAACVAAAVLGGCERPPAAVLSPTTVPSVQAEPPEPSSRGVPKPSTAVFASSSEEQIIKGVQKGTDFSGEPDLEWFTILQDVWYGRSDSHPEFAWDVLRRPQVKLVIGSQLAQAYRNKLIPLNIEDIRKFALAHYTSADYRVASASIMLLGEAGNPADVALLERIGRSGVGEWRMFKEAATALVHICGDDAERAMRVLLADAKGDDREFVEAWLKNRESIVGAWCG